MGVGSSKVEVLPPPKITKETVQIPEPSINPINNVIWIDKNINRNNEENENYLKYLKIKNFTIYKCENIKSGLDIIKKIKFEDTYIIVSGSFYQDFILNFKNNLKDFYVIPKIIIFTWDKNLFLEKNANIKNIIEDSFYNLGGIQTFFDEIYFDFLLKKLWKKKFIIKDNCLNKNNGKQFTFEYIDSIEKLYLPVFYKSLIKLKEKDNFDELTQYLYNKYSNNQDINELLEPIEGISKIPIEILCKYYARLYTIESDFYKKINKNLREAQLEHLLSCANENYYSIIFIKSFYEGIKLGCFPFSLKKNYIDFHV